VLPAVEKSNVEAPGVIYYWYMDPEKIQFCRIYEKASQADLSKAEILQIQTELDP